jgi:hypothetical protein
MRASLYISHRAPDPSNPISALLPAPYDLSWIITYAMPTSALEHMVTGLRMLRTCGPEQLIIVRPGRILFASQGNRTLKEKHSSSVVIGLLCISENCVKSRVRCVRQKVFLVFRNLEFGDH